MNKYEKLIEHIINDEEGKARALFHEIVVEKSRDIYESLMDQEEMDETVGGDQVAGMMDEIQTDEAGIPEDEEMDMDAGDDEIGTDNDMGDEDHHDDVGGDESLEAKVMDLESELEALKAEFEQLMGGDEEPEMDMDGEEPEMDMDGEEPPMGMMEASDDEEDEEEEEVTESQHDDDDEEDDDEKEVTESRHGHKSEIDLMREYVEKLGSYDKVPAGAEGEEVAKGGAVNVNKQSIVAGKNDMGGTTSNIAKGGSNPDPSSTPPAKTSGLLKQGGEIDVAKRNVNKPGGNKGAQNWYSNKASAKSAEGSTTDGSMSVAKDSILKRIN